MSNKTLNVNEDEIAKFEQVASQWWDLSGDFKPLHQINPVRLQFICQQLSLHSDIYKDGIRQKN